jgi:hypothetical protein
MAKGQQRSNREAKKPKASKIAVAPASSTSLTKQVAATASPPKKKG